MSSDMRQSTLIAEWTDAVESELLCPEEPDDERRIAHTKYIESIFDDLAPRMLSAIIVELTGVLKQKDLRRAIATSEVMLDVLQKEYVLSQMPSGLRRLLTIILDDE